MTYSITITSTVNGVSYTRTVEPRRLLSDYLRHDLGLTGTHVGCEHGVCGACTVLLEGEAVRSCLMVAAQVDGRSLTTIEGIAAPNGDLHPVQEAFRQGHGLQCGFCTPGFIISAVAFLRENPTPTEAEIREALSGNICRCTGYVQILAAVKRAAAKMAPVEPQPADGARPS